MNKQIGIYKITNPFGRIYIGSSCDIAQRKDKYRRIGCKSQPKLYNSINKYGWDSHTFEIIEECNIDNLLEKECQYGVSLNVLSRDNLNCRLPKINEKVKTISADTLKKMSDVQKGKKASYESRLKMSESQKGRKHTLETRNKQRLSNKNLKRIINTNTGESFLGNKEAAMSVGMNYLTLKNKLNGSKINDTYFIYVENFQIKE